MKIENKIKPTVKNLSEYFSLGSTTIQEWKKTRPRVYKALKNEFLNIHAKKEKKD